jgi:hypothetical protein
VSFIDFLNILLKILPLKNPKGYDEYKALIDSEKYKKHKNKWRKIYLLNSLIYVVVFTLILVITQSALLSFLAGILATIIGFGVFGNFENKQKQIIQKEICNSNTNCH